MFISTTTGGREWYEPPLGHTNQANYLPYHLKPIFYDVTRINVFRSYYRNDYEEWRNHTVYHFRLHHRLV